jgi:hypothetical protein
MRSSRTVSSAFSISVIFGLQNGSQIQITLGLVHSKACVLVSVASVSVGSFSGPAYLVHAQGGKTMKRFRILLTMCVLAVTLLVPFSGSASALSGRSPFTTTNPGNFNEPFKILSQPFQIAGLNKGSRPTVWPLYPPAEGADWVQVTPYIWHFETGKGTTSFTESWYTMGREGLQWRLDYLVDPQIKQLEARLKADPDNANLQKELAIANNKRERLIANRDKAGSYFDNPNPTSLPDYTQGCPNAANASTSIASQMNGQGWACASGGSADTYVDLDFYRGPAYSHEGLHNDGTTYASLNIYRARVAGYPCDVYAEAHAFWGPFWWDEQTSTEHSADSDCQ